MHLSFERAARQPQVVDHAVNTFFPCGDSHKRFSKVFYNLFPDSSVHNRNMQSFLGIFGEFQYTTECCPDETQAVDQMYRMLEIPKIEDGIYQFWTYLIQMHQKIIQATSRENFENIFAFMNEFPIDETRVVIVGQDPSPLPKCESSGFAFHGSICSSTKSIMEFINEEFKVVDKFCDDPNTIALSKDELDEEKRKCSLMKWIKQGVLMINSKLTLGESFWLHLTDFLIKYISDKYPNIVFVLAGGTAAQKSELINTKKHLLFNVYHPVHPDQIDERLKWNVQLPFINVNFYMHQISQDNRESMIDWVHLSNLDENRSPVIKKLKLFYQEILKVAKKASRMTSFYAGEFVHCDDDDGRVLKLERLNSGFFVIKQIDPYASVETFKNYIDKLVEVESEEVIFQMRNNLGRTLLHEAVNRLDVGLETFKRLVTRSGDINAPDINGNNILMTAQQNGRFRSLIELMKTYGAKPRTIGDSRQNRLGSNETPVKQKHQDIETDDQSKENANLLEEPACKRQRIQ